MTVVSSLNYAISADISKFTRDMRSVSEVLRNAEKNVGNVGSSVQSVQKKSGGIAGVFGGPGGVKNAVKGVAAVTGAISAVGFARDTIGAAMAVEDAEAQFGVFLKNEEAARRMMDALREYDKQTVFTFTNTVNAAEQLLAFGIAGDQVIKTMKSLGDISGGNAERLGRLVYAYGQVRAAGKLMGSEVRQFTEAGFSPLEQISKVTGETTAAVQKRISDGKVSFEEFAAVVESATTGVGDYAGRVAAAMDTTRGQVQLLQGELEQLQVTVGTKLLPWLNELTNVGSGLLKNPIKGTGDLAKYVAENVNPGTMFMEKGTIGKAIDVAVGNTPASPFSASAQDAARQYRLDVALKEMPEDLANKWREYLQPPKGENLAKQISDSYTSQLKPGTGNAFGSLKGIGSSLFDSASNAASFIGSAAVGAVQPNMATDKFMQDWLYQNKVAADAALTAKGAEKLKTFEPVEVTRRGSREEYQMRSRMEREKERAIAEKKMHAEAQAKQDEAIGVLREIRDKQPEPV